jgi:hypothetical protein
MAKTSDEIATKANEIFERARVSDVPVSVLSLQTAMLLGKGDWDPADAEQVALGVLDLLAINGWNKSPSPSSATP